MTSTFFLPEPHAECISSTMRYSGSRLSWCAWYRLCAVCGRASGHVVSGGAVRPGGVVRMEVAVVRRREDGIEMAGEGRVDGRLVISGGCLAVKLAAAGYFNPDDLRVLFSEIHQPETPPA